MKLTFTTTFNSFLLEVSSDMSLGDLKSFVEAESSLSPDDQLWNVKGQPVVASDSTTLGQLGWEEDTMVFLDKKSSGSA